MTIQTRTVEYTHQDVLLEGYMAWDDALEGPRPGVIVAHAFRGREPFECQRAEDLAALGYVGFALDLYGKGVLAESVEEALSIDENLVESHLHKKFLLPLRKRQSKPDARILSQQQPF